MFTRENYYEKLLGLPIRPTGCHESIFA